MNTEITQQEIVLLKNTSFSQRQLCENDTQDDSRMLSDAEKLEEACWSGLLGELLPEIVTNSRFSIWHIGRTEVSLHIEFSMYPAKENEFSIIPFRFMETILLN